MLISKPELALAKLTEKEETRYALSAIAVDHDETVMTNGHYLVAVKHSSQDPASYPVTEGLEHVSPNGKPLLIHRDAAIAALKALPGKKSSPVLQNAAISTNNTLFVNNLESVKQFPSDVNGTFPNWKAVLPAEDKKPVIKFGVGSHYLRLLADYFDQQKDADMSGGATITISVYGPNDAIKMEGSTDDGQPIMALLMPVRI